MITFLNNCLDEPYVYFRKQYQNAIDANQDFIEAIAVSSFNKITDEADSRYVNLKFIKDDEFIFFSNYESPKALSFNSHNQIVALIFWSKINVQIRMKAKIKKTSKEFNKKYFLNRSKDKNALAISSNQSRKIDSYSQVVENFNKAFKNNDLKKCPEYWGGYSFTPYIFEFWEGHESRINKRQVFEKVDGFWEKSFIQP